MQTSEGASAAGPAELVAAGCDVRTVGLELADASRQTEERGR